MLNDPLKIIFDQVGSPTSTTSLAKACWEIIKQKENGLNIPLMMHWCDKGTASWYDIAMAIAEFALEKKLIDYFPEILPIKSSESKTLAKRPAYSALDSSESYEILKLEPLNWKASIKKEIDQIRNK